MRTPEAMDIGWTYKANYTIFRLRLRVRTLESPANSTRQKIQFVQALSLLGACKVQLEARSIIRSRWTKRNNRRQFYMLRFTGSLEDLQNIVARCAIPGDWQLHTKSPFYRFRASTGAILNWWPTTKALNFQGKEAERFKDLFLRHTLVEVEQPEPSLSSDESVWIDLPDPSSPLGGLRKARESARNEKRRMLGSRF
jgi:hypothetical protein